MSELLGVEQLSHLAYVKSVAMLWSYVTADANKLSCATSRFVFIVIKPPQILDVLNVSHLILEVYKQARALSASIMIGKLNGVDLNN